MINDIKISVICSGIRNFYWEQLHQNLSQSSVSFEIVIVGDKPPLKKLPTNFRHVYSSVKPAQCLEIAARNARGELILQIGDDLYFSKNFLDIYYDFYKKHCLDKDMASSLFKRNNKFYSSESYKFWPDVKNSPSLPMAMMIKRELWLSMGGIDKRFTALCGDIDLSLRIMSNGGKVRVCQQVFVNEIMEFRSILSRIKSKIRHLFIKKNKSFGTLYSEYGNKIDRPLLEKILG